MQVLRDVMRTVAATDDDRAFATPRLAVFVLARMHHLAAEAIERRNRGPYRQTAHARGHHHVPRMHGAGSAVGVPQRDVPALRGLVIGASHQFGAGPEVELHRFGVHLEPVGELVLGDVGRPVGRKRHVGQVIHVHLVVQRERVVALAPVVADACLAIDDQRVDLQLRQARGDRQPRLATADHEHRGITIGIRACGVALVEPVGAVEIARVRLATRPGLAELFLMATQRFERGEEHPGFERTACAGIGRQAQHAVAGTDRGVEGEDGLDCRDAHSADLPRCRPCGIDAESSCTRLTLPMAQGVHEHVGTADRAVVPGEREQVAPVAVVMEQRAQWRGVGRIERCLERAQPAFDGCLQGCLSTVWHMLSCSTD